MPKKPELTREQINKMISCNDTFMNSMNKLDKVVIKLNNAALNLEADFIQSPETINNYEYKKRNLEASRKADEEVQMLINEYEDIIKSINDNIHYYNTLITYQTNMDDLTEHYNKSISADKQKIEALKSKKAIAQRMTTYYKKKTENVNWYNYYLNILYWIVFSVIVGCFVYLLGTYKTDISGSISSDISGNILTDANGNKHGIKKTGFVAAIMLFTPYILQPIVTLVKPYLYPYT
tara:strand:+ start:7054 stop:7761 length:708 start_codon:yes stop_codon:yes gene_type:complete